MENTAQNPRKRRSTELGRVLSAPENLDFIIACSAWAQDNIDLVRQERLDANRVFNNYCCCNLLLKHFKCYKLYNHWLCDDDYRVWNRGSIYKSTYYACYTFLGEPTKEWIHLFTPDNLMIRRKMNETFARMVIHYSVAKWLKNRKPLQQTYNDVCSELRNIGI